MRFPRDIMPTGYKSLVHQIELASPEQGGLMRWRGLRLLDAPFAQYEICIPLKNDGNLVQQLQGLTKWCQQLAPTFNLTEHDANYLALAYVARQLQGDNFLLNNQNAHSRACERAKLKHLHAKYWSKEPKNPIAEMFQHLAKILKEPDQKAPDQIETDQKKIEKEAQLKQFLRTANACFYLDTAVTTSIWARSLSENRGDAAKWLNETTTRLRLTKLLRDQLRDEGIHTAKLLAANAYGNNFKVVEKRRKLVAHLLGSITNDWLEIMSDPNNYALSLEKVNSAPPSRDRITKNLRTIAAPSQTLTPKA